MPSIRILLAVSLALNLFLAGLFVGGSWRPAGGPMGAPRPFTLSERTLQDISPEGRETIAPLLENLDSVMLTGFRDRDLQFQRLRDLMAAEPLDQAAIDKLLAELPEQRLDSERQQWLLTSQLLKAASPADRAVLVDVFFRRPGPPPGPGGFDRGPKPPRQ
jgi:uncharacterized membrane protein